MKKNQNINVSYNVHREAYDDVKVVLKYSPSTEIMAHTLHVLVGLNKLKYIKSIMFMKAWVLRTISQKKKAENENMDIQ